MRKVLTVTLLSLICTAAVVAEDTNGDDRITMLLPISISSNHRVSGAYGTLWTGELWVSNLSEFNLWDLQSWPNTPNCFPPGCTLTIPTGYVGAALSPSTKAGDSGALLYIPADAENRIHLSARLLELSRRAQPTGVDIPVVHEDEFFNGPTTFLGVPVAEGIRSTLRVYDPRLRRGTAVNIEFLNPEGEVVASTILRPGDDPVVPAPGQLGQNHTYPFPGTAKINSITDQFPELTQNDRYHIRITPLVPGTEYWALVSVTDNDSQHVLLITAQ